MIAGLCVLVLQFWLVGGTVRINDEHTDISNPDIRRSEFEIILQAEIDLTCLPPLTVTKLWTVIEVDDAGGKLSYVDVRSLAPVKSVLFLQPYFLPVGQYKFVFTVTTNDSSCFDGVKLSDEAFTYVRVPEGDVIVVAIPGPFQGTTVHRVTMARSDVIILTPGHSSYYMHTGPSVVAPYTKMEYFCRRLSETYPSDSNIVGPDGSSTSKGGCYNQGPGKLSFDGNTAEIEASKLEALITYEIKVHFYVSETIFFVGKMYLVTTSSDGLSAALKIGQTLLSCHKPELAQITNEAQRFSANEKLIMKSFCNGHCSLLPGVTFKWTVSSDALGNSPNVFTDLEQYSIGSTSYQITIFPEFFETHKDVSDFAITLEMGVANQPTVQSTILFQVNQPPVPGTCDVDPKSGTVDDTFTLSCSDWDDDDGIKAYVFYTNDTVRRNVVASYWTPTLTVRLQVGREASGFSYNIFVDVIDNYGTFTTVTVGTVTNQMDQEKLFGSPQKLMTMGSSLASMASHNGNFGRMECVYCIFNGIAEETECLSSFDFKCENATNNATQCLMERNICLDFLESVEAEVRTELLQFLTENYPSNTQEDISILASTIDLIGSAGYGGAITINGLDMLSDMIGNIEQIFSNFSNRTTPRYIRSNTDQIVSALGRSLLVYKNSLANPTTSDQEASRTKMLADYDGSLPKDPSEIKYWEEMTDEEIGLTAADIYLQNTGEKLLKNASRLMKAIRDSLIYDMTPGEEPFSTVNVDDGVEVFVKVTKSIDLVKDTKYSGENYSVIFPDFCQLLPYVGDACPHQDIALSLIYFFANMYKYADVKRTLTSGSLDINLSSFMTGKSLDVKNAAEPVEIFIRMDNDSSTAPVYVHPTLAPLTIMKYHKLNVTIPNAWVEVRLNRTNSSVELQMFIQFGKVPGAKLGEYNFSEVINTNSFVLLLNKDIIGNFIGTLHFGVAQLDTSSSGVEIDGNKYSKQFSTDYWLQLVIFNCQYFNEKTKRWRTDGCLVGPLPDDHMSHCLCSHLTSFASGLLVPPNTINFNYVFTHADFTKNIAIYVTIIVIVTTYLILVLWARHKDKQDVLKLGVTPLLDNHPLDRYYYEIIVSTGLRRDAATDSNIFFVLDGDEGRTTVRMLSDPQRPTFRRGQTNQFIMAVPRTLGHLRYLRIWHDNSGKGLYASWFLNNVTVVDLQTQIKYLFCANKWLAVENADGQVERLIPVASLDEVFHFCNLFSNHTKQKLADSHIWLSIFTRPPNTRFTRVQRTTCCLVLLFTTMLVSAMWYGKTKEMSDGHFMAVGPFKISVEEIGVGLFSNMIVFPINFLIACLFKYARVRRSHFEKLQEEIEQSNKKNDPIDDHDKTDVDVIIDKSEAEEDNPNHQIFNVKPMPDSDKRKRKQFTLPWWCQLIAWFLSFIVVGICALFLVAYAIQLSDVKTQKWLCSLILSFLMSVFLTQPIKILFIVLFISLLCKKDFSEEEQHEVFLLGADEEHLYNTNMIAKQPVAYSPLGKKQLLKAREWRLHEIKLYDLCREVTVYAIFLFVVMVVGSRDLFIPIYKQQIAKTFVGDETKYYSMTKVKTPDDFWNWTKRVFVPNCRVPRWYNDEVPIGQRGFFADRTSRILGYSIIRQIRTRNKCTILPKLRSIVKNCFGWSSIYYEDEANYTSRWQPTNSTDEAYPEFSYLSSNVLNGFPFYGNLDVYSGGGYVIEMIGTIRDLIEKLNLLNESSWIDERTRAVMVEFNAYNPFVNLFIFVRLLFEFPPTTGIVPSAWIYPMKLLPYQDGFGLLLMICEVTLCLYVLSFIFKEIRNVVKQGVKLYVQSFWSWIEIIIIIFAITNAVIYISLRVKVKTVLDTFDESHGNLYISLADLSYWYHTYNTILAFIVFLATIKFIKLLRFNRRIAMLNAILQAVGKLKLFWYMMIMALVLVAFCSAFYLSMNNTLVAVSTMKRSIENSFEMVSGKYDFQEMKEANYVLAPFFFFLFCVIIVFVLINICITVLIEVMEQIRLDSSRHSNDFELIAHLMDKMKIFFGTRRRFDKLPVDDYRKDFINYEQLDARFEFMSAKFNQVVFDENSNVKEENKTVVRRGAIKISN